jgi:hypothetical protein
MRRSEGVERLVRRARRERRVLIDVFEGIVRGIVLLPDTVLTKICIVSSDSELDELMLLMLDERRIVAVAERQVRVGVVCVCGCGERVR